VIAEIDLPRGFVERGDLIQAGELKWRKHIYLRENKRHPRT